MGKMIRNWVVAFVVLVVLTLLWHNVVFGGQYPEHLKGIVVHGANGAPAPRMLWFILAHIIVAVPFGLTLPRLSKTMGDYVWGGTMIGFTTFGFFAILAHGLFQNWTVWLMGMDVAFSIIAGAITGWIMSYLAPKNQF